MRIGALEFFTEGEDGRPYIPTRAWAIPDPEGGDTLDDWALSLEPPTTDIHLPLHDLKQWLLFGDKDERFFGRAQSLKDRRRNVDKPRRVRRTDAAEMYLRGQFDRLRPEGSPPRQVNVLLPAIDDDVRRDRYRSVVRMAFPSARILPEPEMVLEYFRLVRRSIVLDPDRNNIILVIDLGASTTDFSVVFSNRGGHVVGGDTTRRREWRLQAIQGRASAVAGDWVDRQIATHLGFTGDDIDEPLLTEVEAAKVAVSSGTSAQVRGVDLDGQILRNVALGVVAELEEVMGKIRADLWARVTGTDHAMRMSEAVREDRGAHTEADALRLIDQVLLAGGTSRLLGFRETIETLLEPSTTIHEVGDAFPVAAAVGALAHVMRDRYDPSRLHIPSESLFLSAAIEPTLEGALDVDIDLEWRRPGDKVAKRHVVLQQGDPRAYEGGWRGEVTFLPNIKRGIFTARFRPDIAKALRQKLRPQELLARVDQPKVGIELTNTRRLALWSDDVDHASLVWIDLNHFSRHRAPSPVQLDGIVPAGSVGFDRADEVVFDFGMSKTVLVAAHTGLLSVAELEAACRGDRLGAPHSASAVEARLLAAESVPIPPEPTAADAVRSSPSVDVPPTHVPARLVSALGPLAATPPTIVTRHETAVHKWEPGLSPAEFGEQLRAVAAWARDKDPAFPIADLTLALMALSVRDFVLLAGPPGCGKSTLVRTIARLLELEQGSSYVEVPVQAHWLDDEHLAAFGFGDDGPDRLVLFDEFNLTRPEYYLTRLFHGATSHRGRTWRAFGTLNIDDTSRPPSPKIVDRCMLLELDPVEWTKGPGTTDVADTPKIGGLARLPAKVTVPEKRIDGLVALLQRTVQKHHLRQDLLPSLRVREDIQRMLWLWNEGTLGGCLDHDVLVDRLIASRLLVKIAGAYEQVRPVIEILEAETQDWAAMQQTQRRIAIAKQQRLLGYVSPWQ